MIGFAASSAAGRVKLGREKKVESRDGRERAEKRGCSSLGFSVFRVLLCMTFFI